MELVSHSLPVADKAQQESSNRAVRVQRKQNEASQRVPFVLLIWLFCWYHIFPLAEILTPPFTFPFPLFIFTQLIPEHIFAFSWRGLYGTLTLHLLVNDHFSHLRFMFDSVNHHHLCFCSEIINIWLRTAAQSVGHKRHVDRPAGVLVHGFKDHVGLTLSKLPSLGTVNSQARWEVGRSFRVSPADWTLVSAALWHVSGV